MTQLHITRFVQGDRRVKVQCLDISYHLLQMYHNKGEHFLIATSLVMKPGSTIIAQKGKTRECYRSTQHLLYQRNSKRTISLKG
jgi:hypothetical protein